MKKLKYFFTVLLIFCLIFAVSCPPDGTPTTPGNPEAKITEPTSEAQELSCYVEYGDQKHVIRLSLEEDTFNPEIYRTSNDPEISITNWFTASDNEEYIKLKAELFFVDSNSASIYLTVTPIKPTEKKKPVTVEFKIPAATENEKWTNSGKEISIPNDFKFVVKTSNIPTPTLKLTKVTNPNYVWGALKVDTKTEYTLTLELDTTDFNTDKLQVGTNVKKIFKKFNELAWFDATVSEIISDKSINILLSFSPTSSDTFENTKNTSISLLKTDNFIDYNDNLYTDDTVITIGFASTASLSPRVTPFRWNLEDDNYNAIFDIKGATLKESFDTTSIQDQLTPFIPANTISVKSITKSNSSITITLQDDGWKTGDMPDTKPSFTISSDQLEPINDFVTIPEEPLKGEFNIRFTI